MVHFQSTDVSEPLAIAINKANIGQLQGAYDDCAKILNVAPDEIDARMLLAKILEQTAPHIAASLAYTVFISRPKYPHIHCQFASNLSEIAEFIKKTSEDVFKKKIIRYFG